VIFSQQPKFDEDRQEKEKTNLRIKEEQKEGKC
jgi:hypothetical protein